MHNLRLKQSLGQNFLKDQNIAKKIVRSIKIDRSSVIIEIGPGSGAITGLLLENFNTVIAVEIDKRFAEIIKEKFSRFGNIIIKNDDFLKINLKSLYAEYGRLNIVGNLPYHITSPVLFKMFESKNYINSAFLMVQREVGKRILSSPNGKDRGILSVLSQYYCKVSSLFKVSRNVFYPVPKVDSLFIQFEFKKKPDSAAKNEELLRNIVKSAFGKRRKYLRNSLKESNNIDIDALNKICDLTRRPEELTVEEFVDLTNKIYSLKDTNAYREN